MFNINVVSPRSKPDQSHTVQTVCEDGPSAETKESDDQNTVK